MSKKHKHRNKLEIIVNHNQASKHGAEFKKTFHKKDLTFVTPITDTQKEVMNVYKYDTNMLLHGTAGCGKTFLAMYLALNEVLDPDSRYEQLIIIRSAVSTRDIGFLPGTEEEKMGAYETPYVAICDELFHYDKSYKNLKLGNYVKFMNTSYLRGITFNNTIVIADECQNFDDGEFSTLITRLGSNSKIVICGDTKQKDLKNSAMVKNLRYFNRMDSMNIVKFDIDDIVRSGTVREYLIAREELD